MDKTLFKKEYPNVKDSISYKNNITKIFKEMYRVLKDDGIATIVFAHKSFKTWEIILNSILESQFVVTATWPIETEMKSRQKAKDDATVTSTIYIVCRKVKKESFCSYSLIKKQLGQHINNKIEFLQKENITGIDFLIALIGSSIEVFGKYEKITDNADNEIKVPQLLKDVRSIVSESAIKSILNAEISSEISNLTRFYIFYRFSFKDKSVDFDDARLLATSLGVDLDYESNRGFIKKTGKIVSCISPVKRNIDEIKEPTELIDVLHKVLILWRNNKKEEYEKLLTESGYANNDTFKRVARAISESLPDDIQEKKWIDQ
jgi:adenine-specific DNA methylase